MRKTFYSSGSLIADKRFQIGQALFDDGDYVAAIDLFEQSIEIAPNWPVAHWSLARARQEIGDESGAAAAYKACLRLDPGDELGASLAIAELQGDHSIKAAPTAYVKSLFNAYSQDFESALLERLSYSTPKKIADAVRQARDINEPFGRALDLGCGTGLAGEALANDIAWLEGVDISEAMIEEARRKNLYDRLEVSDLLAALRGRKEQYQLIIAADVLNYFGDLEQVFAALQARLTDGGLVAFSVEKGNAANWAVHRSLRFSHSEEYVKGVLSAAVLELVSFDETTLRMERGDAVIGLIIVARKGARNCDQRKFHRGGIE